jgi:hypothetical protein
VVGVDRYNLEAATEALFVERQGEELPALASWSDGADMVEDNDGTEDELQNEMTALFAWESEDTGDASSEDCYELEDLFTFCEVDEELMGSKCLWKSPYADYGDGKRGKNGKKNPYVEHTINNDSDVEDTDTSEDDETDVDVRDGNIARTLWQDDVTDLCNDVFNMEEEKENEDPALQRKRDLKEERDSDFTGMSVFEMAKADKANEVLIAFVLESKKRRRKPVPTLHGHGRARVGFSAYALFLEETVL